MKNHALPILSPGQYLLDNKQGVLCVTECESDRITGINIETDRWVVIKNASQIRRLLQNDDPLVLDRTMFSRNEIKARGWTDRMIERHLGEPSGERRNPCYRSQGVNVWSLSRVLHAELNDAANEVKQTQSKRKMRQTQSEKGLRTKREKLLATIEEIVIEVRVFSKDELVLQACGDYNATRACNGGMSASPESGPGFLDRICVNYIRHNLTNYDEVIGNISGQVAVEEAYHLHYTRVMEAIAQKYPWLEEECHRQIESKCDEWLDIMP